MIGEKCVILQKSHMKNERKKIFLMRWNPAISSYKLDVYHENCKDFPDGFSIDWSIWDYKDAHIGDYYVMMRVGDYKPGIIFYGYFVSDPYIDEDWAGTDRKRHYVYMICSGPFSSDDTPLIPISLLRELIPEFDWMNGHSGVVMENQVAKTLVDLMSKVVPNFSFTPKYYCAPALAKLQELLECFAIYCPQVHTQAEEEYDWLLEDSKYCKCIVIPNPYPDGDPVEIELCEDATLYFAGYHIHYDAWDCDWCKDLVDDVKLIVAGRQCVLSVSYEGKPMGSGLIEIADVSRDKIKAYLTRNERSYVGRLRNYNNKICKSGRYVIKLRYFDSGRNVEYSFRLYELTPWVNQYAAFQYRGMRRFRRGK